MRRKSWHTPCTRHSDANAMDDITLARALLVREGWAPTEAWARFVPMVRGIVVQGLGRDFEIDDVIQEIFYRLFAKIGTLEKPEGLRQFVASLALWVVKGEQRRRQTRARITLTISGTVPDRPIEDSSRFDLWDLCRLCDKLAPRQRQVMLLRYVTELTFPEIAQTLGLSLATVKRALRGAQLRVSALSPRP